MVDYAVRPEVHRLQRPAMTDSLPARSRFWRFRNTAIRDEALKVAPGRPNFAAGLRGAVVTIVPVLCAAVLHRPEIAIAGIAGFSIVLTDKGGAYRSRALSMLALTVGGTLATGVGSLLAGHTAASALVLLATAGGAALLRIYGAAATSVGNAVGLAFIITSARPQDNPVGALQCAAFFTLGATWASILSLALWPLRVYRPARFALAGTLRQLSLLAKTLPQAPVDEEAHLQRRQKVGQARTAIDEAREQLGSLRRSRIGPSQRGQALLSLVEVADLLLGALVALEDISFHPQPRQHADLPRWIERLGLEVSGALDEIALALEMNRPLTLASAPHSALAQEIRQATRQPSDHQPQILLRALERSERLVTLANELRTPARVIAVRAPTEPVQPPATSSRLQLLRDHLTLQSAMFRHALRTALLTTGTQILVEWLGMEHGYWATLTAFLIVQPHGSQTWAKALQRVAGTVLGVGIALGALHWIGHPLWTALTVFLSVGLALAWLPLNYGLFTIFVTPAFVLLATAHATHEADLALPRLLNTLLGAALALVGSRLLFPLSEADQLRPLTAQALKQLDGLLRLVAADQPAPIAVRSARRALGISLSNAEASYQRALAETSVTSRQSGGYLTLLLYAHRFASGLIAIAFAKHSMLHSDLQKQAPHMHAVLDALHASLVSPATSAAMPITESDEADTERVALLLDQLAVMQTARGRLSGSQP